MNKDSPAWKIAQATLDSLNTGPGTLDAAIAELKPSPEDMARAYALCFLDPEPFARQSTREILHARMQVMLMREHVKAQERMGIAVNVLTGVLVVIGLIDIALRLCGGD